MIGYLKLIGYVIVIYICTYGIVSRVCTCIEFYIKSKYGVKSYYNKNTEDGNNA